MKVALYARVSTDDKGQDPETQLVELRAWAKSNGHEFDEFVDHASANDWRGRKAWIELRSKVLRPRPAYKAIVIASWDRAFRSMQSGINALAELESHHVDIVELRHGFDMTQPMEKLMARIMIGLAEVWLDEHSQAVRAGMRRAKAQGKHIGRPRARLSGQRAAEMIELHGGIRQAADVLGVSKSTVAARAAQYEKQKNRHSFPENMRPNWPEINSSGPGGSQTPPWESERAVS